MAGNRGVGKTRKGRRPEEPGEQQRKESSWGRKRSVLPGPRGCGKVGEEAAATWIQEKPGREPGFRDSERPRSKEAVNFALKTRSRFWPRDQLAKVGWWTMVLMLAGEEEMMCCLLVGVHPKDRGVICSRVEAVTCLTCLSSPLLVRGTPAGPASCITYRCFFLILTPSISCPICGSWVGWTPVLFLCQSPGLC